MYDPATFGNSKAAIILAKMLNETGDRKAGRAIGRLFELYCRGMRCIDDEIYNAEMKRALAQVWYNASKARMESSKAIPDRLKSYALNIENAIWKKFKRGNTEDLPDDYERDRDEGWGGDSCFGS